MSLPRKKNRLASAVIVSSALLTTGLMAPAASAVDLPHSMPGETIVLENPDGTALYVDGVTPLHQIKLSNDIDGAGSTLDMVFHTLPTDASGDARAFSFFLNEALPENALPAQEIQITDADGNLAATLTMDQTDPNYYDGIITYENGWVEQSPNASFQVSIPLNATTDQVNTLAYMDLAEYDLGTGTQGIDQSLIDTAGTTTRAVSDTVSIAVDDSFTTDFGTPVTFNPMTNDIHTVDIASINFIGADGASTNETTLSVLNQGDFLLNDDGTMTFTPADGFTGSVDPIRYQITDANGVVSVASVVITVAQELTGPDSTSDSATTAGTDPVVLSPLSNDTLTTEGATWDRIALLSGTDEVSTLTTAAGTYVVNDDNTITFTAVEGFTGEATASYVAYDSNGLSATDTLSVLVEAPAPTEPVVEPTDPTSAKDNTTVTGTDPVVISPLSNDTLTTEGATWDRIALLNGTDEVSNMITDGGVFTVNDDNTITFIAANGFVGNATVQYVAYDSNGLSTTNTVDVLVEEGAPDPEEPIVDPDPVDPIPTDPVEEEPTPVDPTPTDPVDPTPAPVDPTPEPTDPIVEPAPTPTPDPATPAPTPIDDDKQDRPVKKVKVKENNGRAHQENSDRVYINTGESNDQAQSMLLGGALMGMSGLGVAMRRFFKKN